MATNKIASDITSRLPVLQGPTNYETWAVQLRNALIMCNHWDIIKGNSLWSAQADNDKKTAWLLNDRQASAMIACYIPPSMQSLQGYEHRVTRDTAGAVNEMFSLSKDLWERLASLYQPHGVANSFTSF